jgi:hypothetical protein
LTISKDHSSLERKAYKSPDGTTFLQLAEQMQQWLNKLRELDLQLASSTAEVERLRKENEDYRALLQLLDKARAMSVQL